MPDGTRYSRSFRTKMDAEAWLATERGAHRPGRVERRRPPAKATAERREREAAANTVRAFPSVTCRAWAAAQHRARLRVPARLTDPPLLRRDALRDVILSEIKAWRASLDASTESTNAAAYRLLRSLLQAAEEEELIDRAPPKIRGASSAPVKRVAVPATFDELAVIFGAMPERLRLLIVLAAFVGLREGELLELRRSDVDGVTGRIDVTRKVDKDANPSVRRVSRGVAPDQRPEDKERAAPFTCHRRS